MQKSIRAIIIKNKFQESRSITDNYELFKSSIACQNSNQNPVRVFPFNLNLKSSFEVDLLYV